MDTVSEPFNSLLEKQIKAGTILVIEENRLAIIAAQHNVIQCSGVDNSWFSSHEINLSQKSKYCKPDPSPETPVLTPVQTATGEAIKIPAKTVVKIRPAKAFKDAIVPPKK